MRRSHANASDAPRAGGDAVDRRDHRLAHRPDRPDDRVVALAHLDVERRRVGLFALGEVLPGTERSSRPGQDHGAHRAIGRQRLERLAQRDLHRDGQRVEGLRPVQGECRDGSVDIDA